MIRRSRPGREFSSVELFRFGKTAAETIDLTFEEGSHGGADNRLFEDLFGEEKSGRLATLEDGIQGVLPGIAVNESLRSGCRVDVQSMRART